MRLGRKLKEFRRPSPSPDRCTSLYLYCRCPFLYVFEMITDFNYWLTGIGCAEVFFSNEKQNLRFKFSYLSDPLADLFQALTKLMKGESKKEKIVFLDEPGQHVLFISKETGDVVSISIFRSAFWDEIGEFLIDENGIELVYSDTDTFSNFGSVICAGVDSLLGRHTLQEYHEKWVIYSFPAELYEELKQSI